MAILAATLLSTPAAPAGPITWTLERVTFGDGGTASGSFVYDANTDTYSAINIVTTAGSAMPTSTYTFFSGGTSAFAGFYDAAGGSTGASFMQLLYATALTNNGGTIDLVLGSNSFEATCGSPASCISGPLRFVTSGSVSSAVPEPASGLLLAAGAAAIYVANRRRNR